MKIKDLIKQEFETGYYICEDCLDIIFIDESEEEFSTTNNIRGMCYNCNKVTLQYPIIKPIFNMFVKLGEAK